MQELIPIIRTAIGEETVPTVNARELYGFLEIESRFNDWIIRRIEEYDFKEGKDFCYSNLSSKTEGSGGHNRKDYHLSVNMAKELAMVERNERGKQARLYFIECERIAQTMRREGPTPARITLEDPMVIMDRMRYERSYASQAYLYEQLKKSSRQRCLRKVPKLIEIVGVDAVAQAFVEVILACGRARYEINHSRNQDKRAYNYMTLKNYAKGLGVPLPDRETLLSALRHDRRFIGERMVTDSALTRRHVRCLLFKRRLDKADRG